MAPPLMALREVALTFGATPLFTSLDMAVHARERLCLVGRNGSGKSTAMKIAAGLVEPDGGERFLQPGTTLRYLPQEPVSLTNGAPVWSRQQTIRHKSQQPGCAKYVQGAA